MEKPPSFQTLVEEKPSNKIDAAAMLQVLDLLSGGPARRALETIDGEPSDISGLYPSEDLHYK